MTINFGREICGNLTTAQEREWLVTNGIGGFASGTIANLLTRRYHGLLVAALNPPLGRTLLLTKLDETAEYNERLYSLYANRWADGATDLYSLRHTERFELEGTIPVWRYACADALLEKRVWMQQGANTTYVQYNLSRGSRSLTLSLKALVNYRDYHGNTQADGWQMTIDPVENGVCVSAFPEAVPFYLLTSKGKATPSHYWYYGFDLAVEKYRGSIESEDHLLAATFEVTIEPGESFTFVASTEENPQLDGETALKMRRTYEQELIALADRSHNSNVPPWIAQLRLAADQFIVNRPTPNAPEGKTILAGYHWFSDWGRDTTISLPGLTIATGRPEIALSILQTFAKYVDKGMLPNRFPDEGETPDYNTVDATLWYFVAVRSYYEATKDENLIRELFPILAEIIDWHRRGTRYNIHLDETDGLLYAGEEGTQLTWMDVKVDDWVVTPRIGKPVEVNALWYNALRTMSFLARQLNKPYDEYEAIADRTQTNFGKFWHQKLGYCYDVIDGPNGNDSTLRPNQIFAVSLPESPLTPEQQRQVVEVCAKVLLTSHGLRSLSPDHPDYQGKYGGDRKSRDGAYHQGTVWGWLIGPFVTAHLRVFQDKATARSFLTPMENQLTIQGLGTLSEIFDGDEPHYPRGCIAQAWTVAEVLRAWEETQ